MDDRRFAYETLVLNEVLCESAVTLDEQAIGAFRRLMGGRPSPPGEPTTAPSSMGLTHGLRLCWEQALLPAGTVRIEETQRFGVPARAGDRLLTRLRVLDRFGHLGHRHLKCETRTVNQLEQLVCDVVFTARLP